MPAVTVPPSPNGWPIATTQSPTRARPESPNFTKGSGAGATILSTARSEVGSRPTSLATYSLRSCSVTVIDSTVAPLVPGRDHVVVGDDIAVGRDDEARAERLHPRASPARRRRPPPSWPNRSPNGVPANGLALCWTVIVCLVEMLTTAGWSLRDHVGEAHRRAGAGRGGVDRAGLVLRGLRRGGVVAASGWRRSPPRSRAPVRAIGVAHDRSSPARIESRCSRYSCGRCRR